MKQSMNRWAAITGWLCFLFAAGLFFLQMGFLLLYRRFGMEYIDNRLFFIVNILCVFFFALSIIFLLKRMVMIKWIISGISVLFIIVNSVLFVQSNREIKNLISLSPDWEHMLVIKERVKTGEAIYYRSYYGILARPREKLPDQVSGPLKVQWLANDIAAVTYRTENHQLQQFIGTYGDRGGGTSYYYVGAEIHGRWRAGHTEVVSSTKGISVSENRATETFSWDDVEQFGTLAVVLKRNNEAVWTLSLNENFKVRSNAAAPTVGNIRLFKASMMKNQPLTLNYISEK